MLTDLGVTEARVLALLGGTCLTVAAFLHGGSSRLSRPPAGSAWRYLGSRPTRARQLSPRLRKREETVAKHDNAPVETCTHQGVGLCGRMTVNATHYAEHYALES